MGLSFPSIGSIAAALACLLTTEPTVAQSVQARFASWQAANPNVPARVAAVKSKTSALIAAHGKPAAGIAEAPVIWRSDEAITELWDDPVAPLLVVIPAGEFTMGPPAGMSLPPGAAESGKTAAPTEAKAIRVRIGYPLAVGKYPVTVREFAAFVAATGFDAGNQCQTTEAGIENNRHWLNPGFAQTDDMPVVCVNFDDAQAYVAWLSKKTGHTYRLPTDAEYEYANRAGSTGVYWWGDAIGTGNANCGTCGGAWDNKQPSPVGRFKPNPFGLYDTAGNVWIRTIDCWNETLINTPTDGSATLKGDCSQRVLRGGGYRSNPLNLRAALRHGNGAEKRFNDDGFRIVRVL